LPAIGLAVASHREPLSPREIERLKMLSLSHLRVDVKLDDPASQWKSDLVRAVAQSRSLAVPLEVALFLTDDAPRELGELSRLCQSAGPEIVRWLVFHVGERSTTERWIRLARPALRSIAPSAPLVSGTNANFCELNRGRPPVELLDGVCYSAQPQEHAYDNASLVETLECLAVTVQSARKFTGSLPLHVTPITLRKRFNPYATGPEPPTPPGELPSQVDPRQMSLFGAAWTLGSLKYLAESNVASVTYFETTGWRGVMETESGSVLPDRFPSQAGAVFPLYHILADAGQSPGAEVLWARSSDTLRVDGLAIRTSNGPGVLLANFTDRPQEVRIARLSNNVALRILDEHNFTTATRDPETFRRERGQIATPDNGSLETMLAPFALVTIQTE
jgi:hypothetical protein